LMISSECMLKCLPAGPSLPTTRLLCKPFSHQTFMNTVTALLTANRG